MTRATGVGSWPGTDVRMALAAVRDTLADSDLPYLPELPGRGPGADLVGRGAGLLVELPVDLQPSGWRLVDRPGGDARRTRALLDQDLDELAEAFDGYAGELKVQVAGPWTLAASVWLHRGERAIVDPGAAQDLVASLAAGVEDHLDRVQRLLPSATLVLQVDEPSLPAVLAGRLPTASGYGVLRAVAPQVASDGLAAVLTASGGRRTVVHCCATGVALPLLRSAGTQGISLDTSLLSAAGWESLAATLESGVELYAGIVAVQPPATGSADDPVSALHDPFVASWTQVGMPVADLAAVTVSPACGLAWLTPEGARRAQELAARLARSLDETAAS